MVKHRFPLRVPKILDISSSMVLYYVSLVPTIYWQRLNDSTQSPTYETVSLSKKIPSDFIYTQTVIRSFVP